MRKRTFWIFFISILLICTACVNFFPVTIDGVLESESPKMRITMNTDPHKFWSDGELTQDDGSVIKIVFADFHGDFAIYEFSEDGQYGTNGTILYEGKCRQKGDSIVLYVDDGSEIVLKKVDETSE